MKLTIVIAVIFITVGCETTDGRHNARAGNNTVDGRNTIFLDTGRMDTSMATISIDRLR